MEFICKKSKPGHYSANQWGGHSFKLLDHYISRIGSFEIPIIVNIP